MENKNSLAVTLTPRGKLGRRLFIKSSALAFLLPPTFLRTFAQSAETSTKATADQTLYVSRRLKGYFDSIAYLSYKTPPRGKNAANGWFRTYVYGEKKTARKAEISLEGEPQKLFDTFVNFRANVKYGFRHRNYRANWTYGQVFWGNLGEFSAELRAIVTDFAVLYFGPPEAQKAASKKLDDDAKSLWRKIRGSNMVWNGEHANGHISADVRSAARKALARLNSDFPASSTSESAKVAGVFKLLCKKIELLPVEGHNPWLRGEWQVKFETIYRAASVTLSSLEDSIKANLRNEAD